MAKKPIFAADARWEKSGKFQKGVQNDCNGRLNGQGNSFLSQYL